MSGTLDTSKISQVITVDANGTPTSAGGGATGTVGSAVGTTGTPVLGSDGTNYRYVSTDSNGKLQIGGVYNGGGGATAGFAGLMVGGTDGTNFRNFTGQNNGPSSSFSLNIVGAYTSGTTGGANTGLMVGGTDGALYRNLNVSPAGTLRVQGDATSGGAFNTTMVQVGGNDGTSFRALSTDASGSLKITLGANSGSTLNIQGNVGSGAADGGANPVKVGGRYNATLPTFADGQRGDLQVDVNGRLIVSTGLNTNFATGVGSATGGTMAQVGGTDGTNSRILLVDTSGNLRVREQYRGQFFNETTTQLTGSATFTGTSRDLGTVAGQRMEFTYFNAFAITDQTGTMRIEGSNDNTTWYTVATAALAINTPLTLQVPVMTRYYRVVVVNGSTAQTTLKVNSSYSAS